MHAHFPFDQYYISVSVSAFSNTIEQQRMWKIFSRHGYDRNGYVLEGHIRQWLEAKDPSVLEHTEILTTISTVGFYFTEEAYYHRFRQVVDAVLSDYNLLEEYTHRADRSRIDQQGHGQKVMVTSTALTRYCPVENKAVPLQQGEVYTLKRYTQTNSYTTYYLQEHPQDSYNSVDFMLEADLPQSKAYWEMIYRGDEEAYRSYFNVEEERLITFSAEEQQQAVYWLELLENFQRQINLVGSGDAARKEERR